MEQEKEVLLEMIHSIQNSQDMRQISDGEPARRGRGGGGGRQRTGAAGVRRDGGGGGPGQGSLQPLREKGRAAPGGWVCPLTTPWVVGLARPGRDPNRHMATVGQHLVSPLRPGQPAVNLEASYTERRRLLISK